jgi:hypothetical protein
MTKEHRNAYGIGVRRKLLAAMLIVAVAVAFSPLVATTAHAASKITMYKGQKVQISVSASNKVSLKSNKSKIIKVTSKGKTSKTNTTDYHFLITAKKKGSVTITAKAKNYQTSSYNFTVKSSYPSGSKKKPIALGTSWKTIKSKSGKKQIRVKATVYKGDTARARILRLEKAPTDGTAIFDRFYWNEPTATSGKTLYLIKFNYKIVKGYPKGKSASFYSLLGGDFQNKSGKRLSTSKDYSRYYIGNGVSSNASKVTNGATGSYYVAVFLKSNIKELRSDDVGKIRDYQSLGPFGVNKALPLSGCVSLKLP